MNYQVIFYTNEQQLTIKHVGYFDHEPTDSEVDAIGLETNCDYAQLYEDVNNDGEYKRFVADYTGILS